MNPRSFELVVRMLVGSTVLASCTPRLVQVDPEQPSSTETTPLEPGRTFELLPVESVGGDFQWRQRVTAEWADGKKSFSAVMSKADGILRLIGLDPMGRVGFVLSLEDGKPVSLEKHPSLRFPFDPRFILLDVQRVFYPWLHPAITSGTRTGSRADVVVRETFESGRLRRRSFLTGPGEERIVAQVTYDYGGGVEPVAQKARYENLVHGYRLTIETLDVESL